MAILIESLALTSLTQELIKLLLEYVEARLHVLLATKRKVNLSYRCSKSAIRQLEGLRSNLRLRVLRLLLLRVWELLLLLLLRVLLLSEFLFLSFQRLFVFMAVVELI